MAEAALALRKSVLKLSGPLIFMVAGAQLSAATALTKSDKGQASTMKNPDATILPAFLCFLETKRKKSHHRQSDDVSFFVVFFNDPNDLNLRHCPIKSQKLRRHPRQCEKKQKSSYSEQNAGER